MKRLIAAVIALAMMIAMTACSEESLGGGDVSSAADSSSVSDSSSEKETTTTTTSASTTTTTTTSATSSETQTKSSSNTDTKTETTPAPAPAAVGVSLITVAEKQFGAKVLTYTGDPQKAFASSASADAGCFRLCGDVKTSKLFDPFDDIIDDVKHVAAVKADSQVFVEFQSFEYEAEGTGRRDSTIDGYVTAVNFNCKDEAEAKKLFPLVFTNEMKSQLITDNDVKKTYFGADCAIATIRDETGLNEMTYAYYRVGNNVLGTCMCSFGDFDGAKPINYTKKIDYKADLDKLCKAFGVQVLPSSIK